MNKEQLNELLYQSLETEQGGIKIYTAALRCAQNDDLEKEWQEYLEPTTKHESIVRTVCGWTRELWIESLGLPAVLLPPEEQKNVTTAIGAARAKHARDDMT